MGLGLLNRHCLTANLTVTSTSSITINGWTLTFSFPGGQQVTRGWNGIFWQSGATVIVTIATNGQALLVVMGIDHLPDSGKDTGT